MCQLLVLAAHARHCSDQTVEGDAAGQATNSISQICCWSRDIADGCWWPVAPLREAPATGGVMQHPRSTGLTINRSATLSVRQTESVFQCDLQLTSPNSCVMFHLLKICHCHTGRSSVPHICSITARFWAGTILRQRKQSKCEEIKQIRNKLDSMHISKNRGGVCLCDSAALVQCPLHLLQAPTHSSANPSQQRGCWDALLWKNIQSSGI